MAFTIQLKTGEAPHCAIVPWDSVWQRHAELKLSLEMHKVYSSYKESNDAFNHTMRESATCVKLSLNTRQNTSV